MRLLPDVRAGAYPPDGLYRYALSREWDADCVWGQVLWIMLNPSTATANEDDPTIRRCQSFTRSWGYGGIIVCNAFGLRSTDPKALKSHPDPIGPGNDVAIEYYLASDDISLVVAAWGVHGTLHGRDVEVARIADRVGRTMHCLGVTKQGHPKHPLYVKGDSPVLQWECTDADFGLSRA